MLPFASSNVLHTCHISLSNVWYRILFKYIVSGCGKCPLSLLSDVHSQMVGIRSAKHTPYVLFG